MNILDIAMVIIIVITMFLGFQVGTIRQLLGIVAVYLAIVIAALSYESFGMMLKSASPGASIDAMYVIAFLLIVLVVGTILFGVTYAVYQHTDLPMLGMWDHIIGAFAGLINGILLITVLLLILSYAVLADWGAANPTRDVLRISQHSSVLNPFFNGVSPNVVAMIRPWTQNRGPAIFGER